jgi:hypothetical protein
MPLVPRINLKKSLRRRGAIGRRRVDSNSVPPRYGGTCAEALLEPRWGWVGTWARMVNAEGLRRFLGTDASRGGWSDKADQIKLAPFAGTRPVPTLRRGSPRATSRESKPAQVRQNQRFPSLIANGERPAPMRGKRGPFHFPPPWSEDNGSQNAAGQRVG